MLHRGRNEGMSAYDKVVCEKLKLKGKALDVKSSGITKRKNKRRSKALHYYLTGGNPAQSKHQSVEMKENDKDKGGGQTAAFDDYLTTAERKFLQQRGKIEQKLLATMATKSHRDRIQEFNQHLANLSEHHHIPKVGPG